MKSDTDLLVRLSFELASALEMYATNVELRSEAWVEALETLRETRTILKQRGIPAIEAVENVLRAASGPTPTDDSNGRR